MKICQINTNQFTPDNMQAKQLKTPQFPKPEGLKHPQNLHNNHEAQNINFVHNKSRLPQKNSKWNAEIEIKTESLRHLSQSISSQTEDKNSIITMVQKSNYSNSTYSNKSYDRTQCQTLSQIEQTTWCTIQQGRKTMESTLEDSNSKQNKTIEKKIDELVSQIESDKALLMKTLFTYSFEAFSAVEVIIRQNVHQKQQQKNIENQFWGEKIFEKNSFSIRDENKNYHAIRVDEIMYPPVASENDFIYNINPLTNTPSLQLNKIKDIYQTDKPRCMLKLQLSVKDLSITIYKLIEYVVSSRNIERLLEQTDQIKRQIEKYIAEIDDYVISYETQAIILLMCDYVINSLQNQLMHQSKGQKSLWHSNEQLINIKQNALNYSLQFLSKLSFYNFVVAVYNFANKRDIPIKIFMSDSLTQSKGSFVDMKIQFFNKTIKNPILLKHLFSESVSHNISRRVSQEIPVSQFDMFNFYKKIYPINSQKEMIDMYIKYQCNFMIFGSEIVIDLVEGDNLLFKELFNYSRFLTSNFLGHFMIKTLKIIDNQIKQCHSSFFYQEFQLAKVNDQRWLQYFKKIKERIDFSKKKIYEYLQPPRDKQNTANSKFIQTESKDLLQFFRQMNNEKRYKNPSIQEAKDLQTIYKYMTEILNKSFFQKDLFRKFFLQLTKNLGIKDWHFSQFLQWNLPVENDIRSKIGFENSINELFKEYKIGQIVILKLFNMFRTLHLYSLANRIEFEQLRKMDGKTDVIPHNYKQVLNKLDLLFINLKSRKRIAVAFMRGKQVSDYEINQNFEIEYDLTKKINDLYIKYNEITNQAYLETTLSHENHMFQQNYFFIPTKSSTSLKKKETTVNNNPPENLTRPSTNPTNNTTQSTDKPHISSSESFANSINEIQQHSYFRLLNQKLNINSHYNFNLNSIMNKHIHRNRLSIFPFKLTKQLIGQVNRNLLFFSQPMDKRQKSLPQIKHLQKQLNERLNAFVNQTLNKSVRELVGQSDTLKGNFSKKQIYNQESIVTNLMEQKNKTYDYNKSPPYSKIDDEANLRKRKEKH